jgi:hypothetical protein
MIVNRLVGAVGYTPVCASFFNVSNPAGESGGSAVTVSLGDTYFTDPYGTGLLPNDGYYSVLVTPSQNCPPSVSDKSTSGFTVTLTPPSGVTLAAGTFDCVVLGG